MKKTLACCYTRYSTDTQNQSSTIGQLRAIRAYCDRNNIELIATYIDEAQSGTNMERENFQKLLNDAPNALWDTIVVYNMSRLSRSVKDTLILKEEFAKMGKKVLSVIENQEDTPEGDFFNLITYGMNELYVKQLKRDSWRGMMTNASECKALGGVPPLGYNYDKNNNYVINPEEAEAVRYIFERITKGDSYQEISNYLNEKGYTNKGRQFTKHLTDILRNEKYIGVYLWNRRENKRTLGKKTNRKLKSEDEIVRIESGIPAIVDKETYNQVQKILDYRKKYNKYKRPKSKYLLTGVLRCGVCGYAFCGGQTFSGRNKTYRPYYRCCRIDKSIKCECKELNRAYLDSYIIKLVEEVILKSESAGLLKEFINNYYSNKIRGIKNKLEALELKRKELKEQSIEYAGRLPYVTDEYYVELTQLIGQNVANRTLIDTQIEELKRSLTTIIRMNQKEVKQALSANRKGFVKEDRKKVIHTIIRKIEINNEWVNTYINIPNLLGLDVDEEEIELMIKEPRSNIATLTRVRKIDFSITMLEKAVKESLKSIDKKLDNIELDTIDTSRDK